MSTWQISYIPMPARHKRTLLLLAGLTVLAAALSLAAGPVVLSPGELWAALMGRSCGTAGTILLHIRLPRTCACLLAGAALAVSGAIIQSVLANPLAAPNIIGVNAGAGLMVALACALAPTALALTPVLAFLGAMAGVLLVLAIAVLVVPPLLRLRRKQRQRRAEANIG